MKRILYIEANTDGTIGGSYYSLLYLLQGMDKTKYEPHVLFCQDNVLIPSFKKITPHVYINDFGPSCNSRILSCTHLIKWPYWFFTEIVLKQFKLKKIINEIKPDLVHLNNGYATMHEWMLACYLNNIRVVAHDRGTRYPCSIRTKLFVRFLDAIISVSDSYKNNVIKQNLKVRRIKRIYNGLDIEKMVANITPFNSERLKEELNIEKGVPLVGIIGNIDRWKGQLIVLKAIKLVKRLYPDIRCLIVGSVCQGAESYRSELNKYIMDNELDKNIVFTGFRQDIPNILTILDVFIHASIEPEPFSRSILEGMAAGKPIIGTNSGGTPEQIIDGETGKLVPMNDPDGMAEAIIYYLSDIQRARAMGEKGRQRLIEKFSIKRMVNEVEKIYEEIFEHPIK